jgi:membrane protease subunit HflC
MEPAPGLHWKIPLVEHVVRLDARTQLAGGRVRAAHEDSNGLALRYSIFWSIAEPMVFYKHTQGEASSVNRQLQSALSPVVKKAMSAGKAKAFLLQPPGALAGPARKALTPLAQKLGVRLVAIKFGTAVIPPKLASGVADAMAANTHREIAAAKASGKRELETIAAKARAKRETVVSEARRKAAKARGKSERKAAAVYAPLAKEAPTFFRYFLRLESEAAALKTHTRVMVISTDSPLFETLGQAKGKRK